MILIIMPGQKDISDFFAHPHSRNPAKHSDFSRSVGPMVSPDAKQPNAQQKKREKQLKSSFSPLVFESKRLFNTILGIMSEEAGLVSSASSLFFRRAGLNQSGVQQNERGNQVMSLFSSSVLESKCLFSTILKITSEEAGLVSSASSLFFERLG